MNKKTFLTLFTTSLFLVLTGCATTNTNPNIYSQRQAMETHHAQIGYVVMVRNVGITNQRRLNTGSAIGTAIGYGLSETVDNHDARRVARIAGSALGGIVGTMAGRKLSKRDAYEIYVRLPNKHNKVVSVVQDSTVKVKPGDEVLLVGRGNNVRVVPVR